MKNKSIITMLCLALGLGMATTSCEDMLTSDSDRHSYEVAGDTLYSYWGILKSLQNIGERYVILGECRGDLIDGGEFTADSIQAILTFGLNGDVENIRDGANRYLKVSDYYHVINSCNAYLAMADTLKTKTDGERYIIREYAQVEAIRAWTYMQLVVNYGEVPFYLTPITSTDDIQALDLTNAANRVNAKTLWDKLNEGGRMERAYAIEEQWGFPEYKQYGFKGDKISAAKLMFPVALVCGDLLLMKAENPSDYAMAASYYYEYLDGDFGGALPNSYYSTAFLPQNEHTPNVANTGYPWNETDEPSKDTESITAIASSTSSLWGTVQRGVNDLYGFDATIRMNTGSDSTTTASVSLSRNWERQLGPSAGFDTLRMRQKYEIYVASEGNLIDDESRSRVIVLDEIGDARGATGTGMGYLARFNSGDYYVDRTENQRYIMKQNPNMRYSTVFPMVYRKSMVWLRFAEAINRAGFPGYAFAILKDGLVKHDEWLASSEEDFAVKTYRTVYMHEGIKFNADGTPMVDEDGNFVDTLIILPADYETNDACVITARDYDLAQFQADSAALADLIKAEGGAHFDTIADFTAYIMEKVEERANYPFERTVVCDYISKQEFDRASGLLWLDFNKNQFSGVSSVRIDYIKDYPLLQNTNPIQATYNAPSGTNNTIGRGIHHKGCGLLNPGEHRSVFNFVDQINLKLVAAGKAPMTKNEIYANVENIDIIEAVEDIILDEAAMELAFEGNRFFDLMRAANRRSNPTQFMIEKIKARGEDAASWADGLTIEDWYLPLPKDLPAIVAPTE